MPYHKATRQLFRNAHILNRFPIVLPTDRGQVAQGQAISYIPLPKSISGFRPNRGAYSQPTQPAHQNPNNLI